MRVELNEQVKRYVFIHHCIQACSVERHLNLFRKHPAMLQVMREDYLE